MADERIKLMIVEDDQEVAFLVRDVLETKGFYCILEENGESVVERAIAEKPRLIVLDIRLTGIDGYTVCRRLKREADTEHIPVIFISALNTQRDVLEAKDAGGVYFLAKPFDINFLVKKIHESLRHSRSEVAPQEKVQVLYAQSEYASEMADPSSALFQLMRASGYRVIVVRDSREIVRKARELQTDIIVLDLDDALLSVWTVEEALWRNRYTASIPRVVLTGIPEREWPSRPNLPQLSPILRKPVDSRLLFRTLQESLMKTVA